MIASAQIELRNQILSPTVDGQKPDWVGSVCADSMKIKDGKSSITITDLKPKEKRWLQV